MHTAVKQELNLDIQFTIC